MMAEHKSSEQSESESESEILKKIAEFDLTKWKQVRNTRIMMLENSEKELTKIVQNTGTAKAVGGGVSALSGAATICGAIVLSPYLLTGGMLTYFYMLLFLCIYFE